jgi:hypothetical protein
MKLFLDDIRYPKDCIDYMHRRIGHLAKFYEDDWVIVRNYDEFCDVLKNHFQEIEVISFDHDLADEHMLDYHKHQGNGNDIIGYEDFKEKTGLDCALFTKEIYKENNLVLPTMFVHSMNPVGTQNIINVFK